MATCKYSFSVLTTFLFYSSSSFLLVLLISCFPEKNEALDLESHFHTLGAGSSHLPPTDCSHYNDTMLDLGRLRDSLARQEDTIIFSLIERAKYPTNSWLYDQALFQFFVKNSEAVQAEIGRYTFEEENAFFPNNLSSPIFWPRKCTTVLHPPGARININKNILDMYLKTLLPQIAVIRSDDGKYAATAASDLDCLQAISKRIHFGKFVAEAKFLSEPKKYTPAILAKNEMALRSFLTDVTVENVVKERVAKKAMIFAGDINGTNTQYKVKPSVVSKLYGDWVIPLTKTVEIEYLLRRLNK